MGPLFNSESFRQFLLKNNITYLSWLIPKNKVQLELSASKFNTAHSIECGFLGKLSREKTPRK